MPLTLTSLPPELIHAVALVGYLTFEDVMSLALTCKALASVILYDDYGRNIHFALRGVVANVESQLWVAARYAVSRSWFVSKDGKPHEAWYGVLQAVDTTPSLLDGPENLQAWESLMVSLLAINSDFNSNSMSSSNSGDFIALLVSMLNTPSRSWIDGSGAGLLLKVAAGANALSFINWMVDNGLWVPNIPEWGKEAVGVAAENGHVDSLLLLLNLGAQVDVIYHPRTARHRTTPLVAASTTGMIETATILLEAGADPNFSPYINPDSSPLATACLKGHFDLAALLVEKGGHFDAELFFRVAENGNLDIVRLLLEAGVDPNPGDSESPFARPLFSASFAGHAQVVELLLEHGARIHQHDGHATALHAAAVSGSIETAQILMENGARVDTVDDLGESPIHRASYNGNPEMVQFLLDRGAQGDRMDFRGRTPLAFAITGREDDDDDSQGHLEVARILLQHGPCVNLAGPDGLTPLAVAAMLGKTSMVELLLENGASVDTADKTGENPLLLAAGGGHLDVVQALIQGGANLDVQSLFGITPIYKAACHEHIEVLGVLLEAGGDPTLSTEDGVSPIIIASGCGQVEIVQLLVQYGADLAATSDSGSTALHDACFNNHVEMAQYLIDQGLDPNEATADARTPLFYASLKGSVEVARTLVENGADLATEFELLTDVAMGENHVEFLEFLEEQGETLGLEWDVEWSDLGPAGEDDGCACCNHHTDFEDGCC